eukprot:12374672-Karenia_brevis.AAC.1
MEHMLEMAGPADSSIPSPPAPSTTPRVKRPRRDFRLHLNRKDWEEGPRGLMSLAQMLTQA